MESAEEPLAMAFVFSDASKSETTSEAFDSAELREFCAVRIGWRTGGMDGALLKMEPPMAFRVDALARSISVLSAWFEP
jgi:hypothetical protein